MLYYPRLAILDIYRFVIAEMRRIQYIIVIYFLLLSPLGASIP